VAAAIFSDSFGMTVGGTRMEKDSMGEMSVPASALYGASTQRAILNFPVSGYRFSRPFIRALGLLKWAAAQANHDLGLLDAERSALIVQAAEEVIEGKLDEHFPLDIFQTGSGTSTNTNANEVIANRCAQLAGKPIGSREPVHPNDHVNMGQSSNDVIPSAIHVSAAEQLKNSLVPALEKLQSALGAKTNEFWEIIKIGRTHLMDATPVRLGQEFSGYAQQVAYAKARAEKAIEVLRELALGGTAVGTGLNRHVDFPGKVMRHLEQRTGIAFFEAKNHFEAQGSKDSVVEASGQLKTIATSLFKIANDVRLLGSGPRCGIGEIQLPATQPGSSIMPGKVNPVMCESMMMVCAEVFGNDACVTWAGANGNFELNVMMPVMAHDFLESIRLLANVVDVFCDKCVTGIVANKKRCQELVELSMAMVTSLAPKIGYDRAAEIAKESAKTGKTVREICREKKVLPEPELARVLDPVGMTEPGGEGSAGG
jgi:fumarate hydratase class II